MYSPNGLALPFHFPSEISNSKPYIEPDNFTNSEPYIRTYDLTNSEPYVGAYDITHRLSYNEPDGRTYVSSDRGAHSGTNDDSNNA